MSFKIDMSKFKKVASDKDHTTLQHEDGHQIKIAHNALSNGHKKDLEKLPMMAQGGEVRDVDHPTYSSSPEEPSRRINLDPEKVKQFQSNSIFNSSGKKLKNDTASNQASGGIVRMAKGGKVNDKLDIEPTGPVDAEQAADNDVEFVTANKKKKLEVEPIKMAKGGDIDYSSIPEESELPAYDPNSKIEAPNTGDVQSFDMGAQVPTPVAAATEQPQSNVASTADTTPTSVASPTQSIPISSKPTMLPAEDQSPQKALPPEAVSSAKDSKFDKLPDTPTYEDAYKRQAKALEAEGVIQAAKANEEKQALTRHLAVANDISQDYQQHYNELENERKAFQDDISNNHIDPNKYMGSMDTGARIATAIGLALGGLGSSLTGGPNMAMDFLNKQIDRDIDTQKANLGKKESLLSANLRQYGNMRDATDMTKIMQNDLVLNQMKKAEAAAAGPAAKARAQQLIAAKEAEIAPLVQQMATRNMLNSANAGGGSSGGRGGSALSGIDPATLVPSVVPEPHQAAVFDEIAGAQNTRKITHSALENFDKVATQYNSAGGLGRLKAAIYSPAELGALESELGSTVGDKEGSVRETSMHTVKNAFLPKATDSPERLAVRRQELVKYLQLKSAAPRAKAFGIDMDKFDSTTRNSANQGPQLTPQQQSFADWGTQNINSSDPQTKAKALAVLKKLGLQ